MENLIDDYDFILSVSRSQFEQLSEDIFARVDPLLQKLLRKSGIGLEQIDEIEIVGGTTRIPRFQSQLKGTFQRYAAIIPANNGPSVNWACTSTLMKEL